MSTELVDSRDGERYTVGKLADGNCWMLENLRLDISDPAVQANLTSTTTNAPNDVLAYLKDGGGSAPYPASGVVAKTADNNAWEHSYNLPYIAVSGTDGDGWTKNTIRPAVGASPAGKNGIYYNFCAASAGSYCYPNNASGTTMYDICPAGWHIPRGDGSTTSELIALRNAYGDNSASTLEALRFVVNGNLTFSTIDKLSANSPAGYIWGAPWAAFPTSTYNMFIAYGNSNSVYSPYTSGDRGVGMSVRCIMNI